MQNPGNATPIIAETSGTIWKLVAEPAAHVAAGDTLAIIESMKMEIPVEADADGAVASFLVAEGDLVEEGQVIGHFLPSA